MIYKRTAPASDFAFYEITFGLFTARSQMNCCGASGPDDYRNSAWFNRSRPVEEVFVPASCCVSDQSFDRRRDALSLQPPSSRSEQPRDQDSCQLNAILFPNNDQSSRSLRTQVGLL